MGVGVARRPTQCQAQLPERSPRHIAALAFAAAGIPVFPCQVNGKKPLPDSHGFEDATTDTATIDAWWAAADYNVAFEPERAGWAIVDIDGPDGEKNWQQFPNRPATYTVRTPRGGFHLYFEGSLPASASKLAPKVDTRGRVSYVLAPPSIVDGKPYTVASDVDIAPLPAWIGEALATTTAVQHAGQADVDLKEVEQRARYYLNGLVARGEVSIEGAGGDNRLYGVCAFLRDLGCTDEMSLALLQEIWNPACVPPWTDDELGVKIANASQYAQNAGGAYASAPTETAFKEYLEKQAVTTGRSTPLPEPIALGSIAGEEKPVEMVVAPWIQKHRLNVFRGRGGSNKSRLALQWSMMIAAGKSGCGFSVQQSTAVLYSCEDDVEEVKRRRNAIAKKLDLGDSPVLYFDMTEEDDAFLMVVDDDTGVHTTKKWDDLIARMGAIVGHKVVVLDSTYDVIDFLGSTKNSDNHVRAVIRLFDRLCRKADCTFICLWHPSRAGMSRGDEGGFATAWDNAPRNAVSIKPMDDDDTFELAAEKRNNLAKGRPVILRWVEGTLQVVTDDDATAIMEHEAVVDVALEAARTGQPIPMKAKPPTWVFEDIEARCGHRMKVSDIRDHLTRECRRENSRLEYRHYDKHGRGEPAGWVKRSKEDWE